jgi:hypothetical protein
MAQLDRRGQIALAMAAGLALLGVGYVAGSGNDDAKPTALRASNTTVVDTTTTTEEPSTTTTALASTTSTAAAPSTTTTKPDVPNERRCQSATSTVHDNAHWQDTWQTQPEPDDPLVVEICIDDVTPRVGQKVTLTITADDPDAKIDSSDQCQVDVYWDGGGDLCHDVIVRTTSTSPVPPEEHGHVVLPLTHTYTQADTYTISVAVYSGPDSPQPHPYADSVYQEMAVTVHK